MWKFYLTLKSDTLQSHTFECAFYSLKTYYNDQSNATRIPRLFIFIFLFLAQIEVNQLQRRKNREQPRHDVHEQEGYQGLTGTCLIKLCLHLYSLNTINNVTNFNGRVLGKKSPKKYGD